MAGERDEMPRDLAVMTFYQIIACPRGAQLVELLSLEQQPSPAMWGHFESWYLIAKVSISAVYFYQKSIIWDIHRPHTKMPIEFKIPNQLSLIMFSREQE